SEKKYMFLLADDYTRYMWVYFLKSKDEAFEIFNEFKLKVENQVGKKLKSFRTDRGGEFTSREFTRYCKENGILRQLTSPYSPQQNGIAEAIRHAVYVLNRVPTKALEDSTPYEVLKDRKPNMRHLRVFGCKAYAKVTKPHLKKLDDRSRELAYLGTKPGSKAYRLFNHVTKYMVVSRDVKFKEDEGWDWKGYLHNINPSARMEGFIISENQTSNSRIIDEVSTQDLERNDEDSTPSHMQNNTYGDIFDDEEIEQLIDNPSTPLPYTYELNSEDSTGYTSSIASSSRPFDHTPVQGDVKFKEDEGWDWKGYLDNINPSEPEWRDFIISENQTLNSRIIDEVSTQDSKRNDEDNNPSTPPPYTYEPNSEDSTGYTSSIVSSSRPFDHTPVRGYRNLSEIYDRAPEVQSDELLLLEEEPRNYKEATQDKK
nr:zinc finger, CCHC-type [Tanacetum cinerariifolium]